MGFKSFIELFVAKIFHEDLETISSFFMLAHPQATFAMFLLCYAQHLGYLFHTMFPSLIILQHHVEFNICTIIMLEKILGAGSFGGSINHLTHLQTTLHASSSELDLPSIVQATILAFLGCWALIAPTLVIHF